MVFLCLESLFLHFIDIVIDEHLFWTPLFLLLLLFSCQPFVFHQPFNMHGLCYYKTRVVAHCGCKSAATVGGVMCQIFNKNKSNGQNACGAMLDCCIRCDVGPLFTSALLCCERWILSSLFQYHTNTKTNTKTNTNTNGQLNF